MTINDLVTQARQDYLDDTVLPYLWGGDQLTRYANEAVTEACLRSPLIERAYTINVAANTSEYAIDESVRTIRLAKLALPLVKTSEYELTISHGGLSWLEKKGEPSHFLHKKNKITLFPVPIVNGTLVLGTINTPDSAFDIEADIRPEYHNSLIFWILHKAYSCNDVDMLNETKAAQYLARFDDAFGLRQSAKMDAVIMGASAKPAMMCGRIA